MLQLCLEWSGFSPLVLYMYVCNRRHFTHLNQICYDNVDIKLTSKPGNIRTALFFRE